MSDADPLASDFILLIFMSIITLRVYGILINEKQQVLVSDEYIRGGYFTKFPGGGLEFGEGTRDCLKREFIEEMNLRVEVGEHLYTTDIFMPSAFREGQQIISVYYLVRPLEEIRVPLREIAFHFDDEQLAVYNAKGEIESFRFINWEDLSEESVTLPLDKIVVRMIKSRGASQNPVPIAAFPR
jgi:8-oxo-dGTP diphosphatase